MLGCSTNQDRLLFATLRPVYTKIIFYINLGLFWLESLRGELDVARTVFLEFMLPFVTLCVLSIGTPNANMVQILLVTMITEMIAQGGLTNLLLN